MSRRDFGGSIGWGQGVSMDYVEDNQLPKNIANNKNYGEIVFPQFGKWLFKVSYIDASDIKYIVGVGVNPNWWVIRFKGGDTQSYNTLDAFEQTIRFIEQPNHYWNKSIDWWDILRTIINEHNRRVAKYIQSKRNR